MPENLVDAPNQVGLFRWAGETDVGRVREKNEDTFFADPHVPIFLVSDGMGGHQGGELASRIVSEDLPVMIETALYRLRTGVPRTIMKLLDRAIAEQDRKSVV